MSIAPQVKDATEAIQQMPPLVDAIVSLFQTPTGWVVLAAFLFWLLVNKDFSHLFDIFERKERRRFEHLDLYVSKSELADKESVNVLRDLRDAHYFKIATGIYAEKRLRSAIINLHSKTSHLVNWRQIRRAFPYIEVNEGGTATVRELHRLETVGYWYNQVVGYAALLVAAGIFSLFVLSNGKMLGTLAWGIGGCLAVVFFGMFSFAQNWPVDAAKRIRKEITRSEPARKKT